MTMTSNDDQIRQDAAEAMRRAEAEDEILVPLLPPHLAPLLMEEGKRCEALHEDEQEEKYQQSPLTKEEIHSNAADAMRQADQYS